jgi:hypothetical protein
MMAKQNPQTSTEGEGAGQECKILLGEMQQMLVKQHKDPSVQRAYSDCFILLTKHYYEQSLTDKQVREFLTASFKEMLNKFLCGRLPASTGLNTRFFQQLFEACPCMGWHLIKVILRCFLPKAPKDAKEDAKEDEKKEEGDGSRSNTQRMFAIELCGQLVKASSKDKEARTLMAKHFSLVAAVICKVV